jgi:FlaA1/EpsC-like NDP-sugar epimerase
LFVVDVIGLGMASTLALAAWLDSQSGIANLGMYVWVVGIIVATRVAMNIVLGLYATSWRFASISDMGRILACAILGTAFAASIVLVVGNLSPQPDERIPPMFWLVDLALSLAVLATPRFLIRAASELSDTAGTRIDTQRTLLYGAGWAGVIIARSAERDSTSGVLPVGFLDDNAGLKGRRVAGLLVYGGVDQLARAKRRSQATALLITMPRASGETVRQIVEAAMELGLEVRTVPPVTDLIDGTVDTTRIRQVRVEDLLRRPLALDHAPAMEELLAGQRDVRRADGQPL